MKHRARSIPRARRGFSLIEAITTMVVLAVIGTTASSIITGVMAGYTQAAVAAQLQTEGSTAMERLIREFQKIAADPNASALAPEIASVTATSMSWNGDCHLTLADRNLFLTTDGGPAAALLTDVTSFSITPFDEDDAPIALPILGAACEPVRRIQLEFTLQRNGASVSMRAKAFIRSMMAGGSA